MANKFKSAVANRENKTVVSANRGDEKLAQDNSTAEQESEGEFKGARKNETIKKENFSVVIEPETKNVIDKDMKQKNLKANTIINSMFSEIFNRETKSFTIDIPVAEKKTTRTTTYLVDVEIIKALRKQAKQRNMTVSGYFNALVAGYTKK